MHTGSSSINNKKCQFYTPLMSSCMVTSSDECKMKHWYFPASLCVSLWSLMEKFPFTYSSETASILFFKTGSWCSVDQCPSFMSYTFRLSLYLQDTLMSWRLCSFLLEAHGKTTESPITPSSWIDGYSEVRETSKVYTQFSCT